MEVICLESEALYGLVEKVVERIKEKNNIKHDKWVDTQTAMQILQVKSKTTLQTLRNSGKIRYTQPQKKIILYDRDSLNEYLDNHTRFTF